MRLEQEIILGFKIRTMMALSFGIGSNSVLECSLVFGIMGKTHIKQIVMESL